jgi:Zn-dependent protease with chaperone function
MTTPGDIHKKRGAMAIKTGVAMLVFGVAVALAFGYGQEEPGGIVGFASLVAFIGFLTAIIGIGKWRERPAGD